MNYIDESTHLQLTNAIAELTGVINAMQDRGSRPTWEESAKVRKAGELRQIALVQLKRAGVTIESAPATGENRPETGRHYTVVELGARIVVGNDKIEPRPIHGP